MVVNDDDWEYVNSMVPLNIPVYTTQQFEQLTVYKYVKGPEGDLGYTNQPPNLCYSNLGGGEYIYLSEGNIHSTLLNSGYTRKQIDSILSDKTYQQVAQFLDQLWKTNTIVHPVIIHPPYPM